MKRVNNIYKNICNTDNIILYTHIVSVNTKNKLIVEKYEQHYVELIYHIKNTLCSKNYIPGKYNFFFIYEPKLRLIMSNNFEDKIINHLVAKYLLYDVLDKSLINTTVATRIGKGTHYGLKLLKKYINIMKNKYNDFYYFKFDIEKYFYNIDHKILKEMLMKKIKDKDALDIIFKIIDSTDCDYINEKIKILKDKEIKRINNLNISNKEKGNMIDKVNKIPYCKKGKSLPIGSMCSQILAVFYLDELNHYIKEELHIKYYILYMDDGVLLHKNKDYLLFCKEMINNFLNNKLLLKFNNKKTMIHSINNGIDFLGFRFIIINNKLILKVRNNTKKRFVRKVKNNKNNKELINSYINHLSYGNCNNLINKYI